MERQVDDWLEGYLTLTENSEPPLIYRRWVGLYVLAAVLQRKCYLPWGSDLTFYPNLYIALTSPPGRARKSFAINQGRKFLTNSRFSVKLAAEALTREAMFKAIKEAEDNSTESGLHIHSSLSVVARELVSFIGHRNFQFLSDLSDLYDCPGTWTNRTKNMGTDELVGVWLNMIGAITPDLIREALPMTFIGGGLTSRMIFVYSAKRAKAVSDPTETPAEKKLRSQLEADLVQISDISGEFYPTKDFKDVWAGWYPSQEDNPPFEDDKFSGYFDRRTDYPMKLSIILSGARRNTRQITGGDLIDAIEILKEVEVDMRFALSGVGKHVFADVQQKIMADLAIRKRIPVSVILNRYKADISMSDLKTILGTLEAMRYATLMENTNEIWLNTEFGRD